MNRSRKPISGPLAKHAEGLRKELQTQGYKRLSIRNLIRVLADLSAWLEHSRLNPGELNQPQLEKYLRYRKRAGRSSYLTPQSLVAIVRYLRQVNAIPEAKRIEEPEPSTALESLFERYIEHLNNERGLTRKAANQYLNTARAFLSPLVGDGLPKQKAGVIGVKDVCNFVLRMARKQSTGTAKLTVSGLRSLLRYLYMQGEIDSDLAGAVPSVAMWRDASLPKAVEPEIVERLLASCDRRSHLGRRDYTVMLLMIRLGLRACEVAALELDDLDWVNGSALIRGKGRHMNKLPLPEDVGCALAAYVTRSRPRIDSRSVFVTVYAPYRPMSKQAIKTVVRSRCIKLGLPPIGAHRLRHTAATQMLRRGATLDEIAQVLRHRDVGTTTIYAKVDRASLKELARPWPGGCHE